MNSIQRSGEKDKGANGKIARFCREYKVGNAYRASCGYVKSKGIAVMTLLQYLLGLVFTGRTMYMNMLSDEAGFGKDSVYRLLKSVHTNWLRFTTLLCAEIIGKSVERLTGEERRNVLIVDDSLYERGRAKKAELLSRVYDHAKHRHTQGYRLLTLGWSDGNTFLPVNSCLLSGKEPLCEAKKTDKRTAGGQRRKLAQTKATEAMLTLIREAKRAKIPAKHVLFDSWFCFPSVVSKVKALGYEVVAMVKRMPNVTYICEGKAQTIQEIYQNHRKRRGMSRYKLSVEVTVESGEASFPARLVYVVNRNNRKDYLTILCTDMTMSEDEILQAYAKRWDIEVFFKMCKSYLRLTGEWKTLSYDAMTAGVAIVFVRYMLLAIKERNEQDPRTFGELFYVCMDELPDINLAEALHRILHIMHDVLVNDFGSNLFDADRAVEIFVEKLPFELRNLLKSCA